MSRTFCLEPLVLPPTSSRNPLKQGRKRRVGEQAILSCKCSVGSADRIVCLLALPLFETGSAVRFFRVCIGVPCQFCVLLFLGSLFGKNFRGRTFVFWASVLVLCVLMVFCLVRFLPYILAFRSRNCLEKFSWRQVFCFGVFSLFLRFFVDVVFGSFFLKKQRLGNNKTPHTHLSLSVFVLRFVPPRLVYRPFWPCVLFLGVFSGNRSGPARH